MYTRINSLCCSVTSCTAIPEACNCGLPHHNESQCTTVVWISISSPLGLWDLDPESQRQHETLSTFMQSHASVPIAVSIPSTAYYETYVCMTFMGCPTQSQACCLSLYYVCVLLCVHNAHIWCLLGMCMWWCFYAICCMYLYTNVWCIYAYVLHLTVIVVWKMIRHSGKCAYVITDTILYLRCLQSCLAHFAASEECAFKVLCCIYRQSTPSETLQEICEQKSSR